MKLKKMIKKFFWSLKKYFYKQKAMRSICEYDNPVKINAKCIFNGNTYLGSNTNFNGMKIIGNGKVEIGDNFHSGSECLIITDVHDFDHGDSIPYDSKNYIIKDVSIEDNVWIGTRVIILGGVTIGEGSIIQAGAVVVKDIPKYGIAGGSPAKTFKFRDKEHYEKRKIEGAFH